MVSNYYIRYMYRVYSKALQRFAGGIVFFKKKRAGEKNIRFCFFTTEKIAIFAIAFADMAQLVEQRIRNA